MPLNTILRDKFNLFDSLDLSEPEQELFQNRAATLDSCSFFSPLKLQDQEGLLRSADTFRLLHHNVRSLKKNGEKFKDFLYNTNVTFSAILISETWLRNAIPHPEITNYTFSGQNRQNRVGGGVGIYVNNALNFHVRKD